MRVLLVSANFRPRIGGIESFTEILARGLGRRNHHVTVLACRYAQAPRTEELDGFEVVRVPASYALDRRVNVPYPVPSPPAFLGAARALVARADVVHVNDFSYLTSAAALVLARRGRVPSVLTQHVPFVPQGARWKDGLQRAVLASLAWNARLATRVVALNPAVARWAEQFVGLDEVAVLPVGVPSGAIRRDRTELRASFDLPPDRFIALFVGRDVPKKGLDVFLASGSAEYDLVAVTDRRGAGPGATMFPLLSPARLQQLLSCADAFVLPSEAEGFPMTLQEALACGVPVVTTALPGYEAFLSSDDVLFVERDPASVRDALRRLAASESLWSNLSERARAVARTHFDEERFVTAYERLYRELCGGLPMSSEAPG